jgi:hypothetical protein
MSSIFDQLSEVILHHSEIIKTFEHRNPTELLDMYTNYISSPVNYIDSFKTVINKSLAITSNTTYTKTLIDYLQIVHDFYVSSDITNIHTVNLMGIVYVAIKKIEMAQLKAVSLGQCLPLEDALFSFTNFGITLKTKININTIDKLISLNDKCIHIAKQYHNDYSSSTRDGNDLLRAITIELCQSIIDICNDTRHRLDDFNAQNLHELTAMPNNEVIPDSVAQLKDSVAQLKTA